MANIMIINDYIEKTGGAEIYDHELKRLLESRGYQVKIVGGRKINNLYTSFLVSWFSLRYKKIIECEIRKFKPDIIFAHSIVYNVSPSFLIDAKKMKIPVVLKLANLYQYEYPEITFHEPYRILTWLKKWTHRETVRKYVSVFIAPSRTSVKWLKNNLRVKNVKMIPNPIFWEIKGKNLKARQDRKKILYVGVLEGYKGIEYLIMAFSKISKIFGSNVKLEIIGEGTYKRRLKSLVVREKIQDVVNFRGYIQHEKLKEEYAKADVFVLPSIIEENSPLTPLEAMSQGTPVITTNIGGQAELVRDRYNGFLVKPCDPNDLAEKILAILESDKLRRKM